MYKRIAFIAAQADVYDVQDELIDRYGDIPEEVQNLIFIALIKAEAQRAYIQRLMVRDGEVRIVFDPEAPMDGAKLFAAANNIAGARHAARGSAHNSHTPAQVRCEKTVQ